MKRFPVFDSLCGLCALTLIVHHSHIERSFTELALFRNASYFVELFFAISGFLIYRHYMNHLATPRQLRDFVITQTCRVYPLHVFMLVVFIGFECAKLVLERYGMSLNSAAFSGDRAPAEILPNLLLIQAWWPGFNALSFNYPSWAVSVQYYLALLFALIVFLVPALARKILTLLAVLSFVALFVETPLLTPNLQWGAAAFFGGALTYRVYLRLHDFAPGRLLASVLEIAILALIYVIMTEGEKPLTLELALLFCVAVLIFAFEAGVVSQLLRLRPFRWLGKLWLSIYMTHAAVIFAVGTALQIIAKRTGTTLFADLPGDAAGTMVRYVSTGTGINDNLIMVFLIVTVVVVSMLTYRYVEAQGVLLGKRWKAGKIVDRRQGPDASRSI
ncbi:MAG TPA: acyltransferase [Pseudomonas sp.]|uniref:acyltransferase family protein n=1 Tax=Pseudomonas sp. TaxID=306 RepID=UPI002ED9CE3C